MMKYHKKNKFSNFLDNISKWTLYLMIATFPLSLFLNNLFATVFLISFGLFLLVNQSLIDNNAGRNKWFLFVVFSIPFLLTLMGSLYSSNPSGAVKMIGKIAPLFFFAFYAVFQGQWFENKIKPAFLFLVFGCLVSAILSWGLSLYEIFKLNLPISALFTQEFAYHNLAEKLGVHTPYLALFINAALGFIVYSFYDKKKFLPKPLLWLLFIILTGFLFNLMARNAIFCFLLFGVIYLIKSKNYLLLLFFFIIVSALTFYIYDTEKNFLRDRFIYGVNIFEEETIFSKKDNRFARWQASVEVFKQFPILGPGTDAAEKFRKEQYVINLDSEAYNEGYNAHNQFFEYLSTYGLLGALLFILMVFYLIKVTLKQQSVLLLYLLGCFLLAMVTESILIRSWGVMYYGFFIICILSWNIKTSKFK
ncbi:MAG: O-antigen ligase family protein [Flavobacteriaceae bacterium]|nr:O-antigen ligase family protein [Flavobacteriaceae bacterium]